MQVEAEWLNIVVPCCVSCVMASAAWHPAQAMLVAHAEPRCIPMDLCRPSTALHCCARQGNGPSSCPKHLTIPWLAAGSLCTSQPATPAAAHAPGHATSGKCCLLTAQTASMESTAIFCTSRGPDPAATQAPGHATSGSVARTMPAQYSDSSHCRQCPSPVCRVAYCCSCPIAWTRHVWQYSAHDACS